MATTNLFLRDLPRQVATAVQVVPELNQSLLANSLQKLLNKESGLKEQLVVREFDININFYINKSSSGRIFFFFKRKKQNMEVVMDLKVGLKIRPTIDELNPQILALTPITFQWQVPPFLILDPKERQLLAGDSGSFLSESTLIFSDGGKNTLLVNFAQEHSASEAKLWFKGQIIRPDNHNNWPAKPFFVVFEYLREWVALEWKSDYKVPLKLENSNDPSRILKMVTQAFIATRAVLVTGKSNVSKSTNWLQKSSIDYDVSSYLINLLLRLDKEGAMATYNSKQSFQFGLTMAIQAEEQGMTALIDMYLPDFLIQGDLFRAFWSVFLDEDDAEDIRKELRKKLQKKGYPELTDSELCNLLELGEMGEGTVFRIDRNRDVDINIFIVSGKINQELVHLIFSGKFVVKNLSPPKIQFKGKRSLQVHFSPKENTLDQDIVEYFLRMVKYFKNWSDIL